MKKEVFFKYYIPALETALNYERQIDFETISPDNFVDDDQIRNDLDKFENENYTGFEKFFYLVSIYFDAKNHNFRSADDKDLSVVKNEILNEVESLKNKFF